MVNGIFFGMNKLNQARLSEIVSYAAKYRHVVVNAAAYTRSLFLLQEDLGEPACKGAVRFLTLPEALRHEEIIVEVLLKHLLLHSQSVCLAGCAPDQPILLDTRGKWMSASRKLKIGVPSPWMIEDYREFFVEREGEYRDALIFVLEAGALLGGNVFSVFYDPLVSGSLQRELPSYVYDYVREVSSESMLALVFHRRGLDGFAIYFSSDSAAGFVYSILERAHLTLSLYNQKPPGLS